MALIVYFKLKMALIFALILTLSVLTIWNIQLSFPESRVFVVGFDAGWNLFYLNEVLSSWKLKDLLFESIVKSQLVEGTHVLNYVDKEILLTEKREQPLLRLRQVRSSIKINIFIFVSSNSRINEILLKFYDNRLR